jgi:hypothetical protein
MGIGCMCRCQTSPIQDNNNLIPNNGINFCCMADNLFLKFAANDGETHFAYLQCKKCGKRFTYEISL